MSDQEPKRPDFKPPDIPWGDEAQRWLVDTLEQSEVYIERLELCIQQLKDANDRQAETIRKIRNIVTGQSGEKSEKEG